MILNDLLKPVSPQSFLVGVGVAAAAYLLGPQLKEALRPSAVKGAQGAMAIGDRTKQLFEESREKLSDIIFQKGEGMRAMESFDLPGYLVKELKEEREISNKILEELKNSIVGLKEEIVSLRNGGSYQQG